MKIIALLITIALALPAVAQDSPEGAEIKALMSAIDKQALIIKDEYKKSHLDTSNETYGNIWGSEYAVADYLELAANIIDTTNAIPADKQDWKTKFKLWRSLYLLDQQCQLSQLSLAQSLPDVKQPEIKAAIVIQIENTKSGCSEIESKMNKYDLSEHHKTIEIIKER